jgi:hypothetical protein
MERREAVALAHKLTKETKRPAAIFERKRKGKAAELSIQSADVEAPGEGFRLVMIVSVTGLERAYSRWA